MSMIGNFGKCTENDYNRLVAAIRKNQSDAADDLIEKLYNELENAVEALESDQCSGEVFLAVFQYFQTEFDIELYGDEEQKALYERWREITEDCDVRIFTKKEKAQLLSLADRIDSNEITAYVNDFFQNDYGDAGQIACAVLLENLRKLEADNVLLWHLC